MHVAITTALKLKEEFGMIPSNMAKLMENDMVVVLELSMFVSNTKHQICDVFQWFFSFLLKHGKKKSYNMFLMLNPIFRVLGWDILLLVESKFFLWSNIMIDGLCFQCC
jgi:hypothetical protein